MSDEITTDPGAQFYNGVFELIDGAREDLTASDVHLVLSIILRQIEANSMDSMVTVEDN